MSDKPIKIIVYLNLIAGIVIVVVGAIAIGNATSSSSNLKLSNIANCKRGARIAAASLNFDYFIYHADFNSAHDTTLNAKERANRLSEAQNLLHQDELRAVRVDVSALNVTGPYRLIDPTIRRVIRATDYQCSKQFNS